MGGSFEYWCWGRMQKAAGFTASVYPASGESGGDSTSGGGCIVTKVFECRLLSTSRARGEARACRGEAFAVLSAGWPQE